MSRILHYYFDKNCFVWEQKISSLNGDLLEEVIYSDVPRDKKEAKNFLKFLFHKALDEGRVLSFNEFSLTVRNK